MTSNPSGCWAKARLAPAQRHPGERVALWVRAREEDATDRCGRQLQETQAIGRQCLVMKW